MRRIVIALLFCIAAGASAGVYLRGAAQAGASIPSKAETELAAIIRAGCGPQPDFTLIAKETSFVSGMGNARYPGASPQAGAQSWFDYALTLAHAFQHKDAIAAFRQAQRKDAGCALCFWGEAWASGPTINYQVTSAQRAGAGQLLTKASRLAVGAPEKTRALIAATLKRAQKGDAKKQDVAFAEAMDKLAARYPDDVEIAVLTADAWLIANFTWQDARGYPRALTLLEGALQRRPNDAGAMHFYIHAAEMANQPQKALDVARRLPSTAPSASHLVHMPSHVYYRIGDYAKAVAANRDAVDAARSYAAKAKFKGPLGGLGYYGHNLNYGIAAAMLSGDGKAALEFASEFEESYPDLAQLSPWSQFEAAKYYMALGRFAEPGRVLALKPPSAPFLRAMLHYARGEALARKGDAKGMRAEALRMHLSAGELKPFADVSAVAHGILDAGRYTLRGRAAMLDKQWEDAASAFELAAQAEEGPLASHKDPAMWWSAPRRSAAAAFIKAGAPHKARKAALKVLSRWPNDPSALYALSQAQLALGQKKQANESLKAARAGWRGGDSELRLMGL